MGLTKSTGESGLSVFPNSFSGWATAAHAAAACGEAPGCRRALTPNRDLIWRICSFHFIKLTGFQENPPSGGGIVSNNKSAQLRLESRGPSSSAETLCVVDISHNFPKKTRLASRTFQLWAAVCLLDELQVQTVVDGSSNCRLIHLRSGSVRYSCRRTCSFSAVSEMQSSSLDVPTLDTWLPGLPLAFWWPLTLTPSLKLLLSPIPSDTTSKDQKKKKIRKIRSVTQPPSRAGVTTSRRFLWRTRYTTAIRSLLQLSSCHKKSRNNLRKT